MENKNVTYEYSLDAHSNVNDILKALMEQNGDNAVDIPGYSVMQLIVENLIVFLNYGDEAIATFKGIIFPNDVAKIAYLIRNYVAPEPVVEDSTI